MFLPTIRAWKALDYSYSESTTATICDIKTTIYGRMYEFKYVIDGIEYRGCENGYGRLSGSIAHERLIGTEVAILYNQDDPNIFIVHQDEREELYQQPLYDYNYAVLIIFAICVIVLAFTC
jgi:hypothetical protein